MNIHRLLSPSPHRSPSTLWRSPHQRKLQLLSTFFFPFPSQPAVSPLPHAHACLSNAAPAGRSPRASAGRGGTRGEREADTRTPPGHPRPPATPGGRRAGGCGATGRRGVERGCGEEWRGDAGRRGMRTGGGMRMEEGCGKPPPPCPRLCLRPAHARRRRRGRGRRRNKGGSAPLPDPRAPPGRPCQPRGSSG